MKRPALLLTLTLAAALWGGAAAVRQALRPAADFGEWLRNPLRLAQRVTPSGPVVLEQVQRLQRLETCRYNGQVVVKGEQKGWLPVWLAGDRLLFMGRGEVVAGVDLGRMAPGDIRVTADAVELRLPEPEILHTRLDNRASEVFERRSGVLTGPKVDLETQVRQEAEDRIRSAAMESGVLTTAGTNARETLRRQMEALGFRQVRFL